MCNINKWTLSLILVISASLGTAEELDLESTCASNLKSYLYRKGYQAKYSSIWVGNYIECPVEGSEYENICLMRATFYPRKNSQKQKTENFIVGSSSHLGTTKVFTAKEVKLKESGPFINLSMKLDLKPVGHIEKPEKVTIHRKKMQVVLANRNIISQCLHKSTQGDFVKF
jgi:hypothetical protein